MTVSFSDPHQAISWDGMHAHDHGLGGKHLWPTLQKYIKQIGRNGPSQVDFQYVLPLRHLVQIHWNTVLILCRAKSLPTWRKFYHFDKIMDISYTDASKLKDLVKVGCTTLLIHLNNFQL